MKIKLTAYLTSLALLSSAAVALPRALPSAPVSQAAGKLEVVHRFYGHMPIGVTVNSQGRMFVSYPNWEDDVPFSIAEIKGGREVPYPNRAINTRDLSKPDTTFIGVQGLLVDARDRLWVLDTGTRNLGPILDQRAVKLVGIDTHTNEVVKTIHFPADVALKNTYLNDLRIDLRQGTGGVAYITDSGPRAARG
ncbi:major royal jelly family protein [Deinococcus radiodurans]|uniref:major royal jelly family protein n=1 Tax=Deinococcus radiodurans TaxID=1299 RepID=UPI001FB59412|nr:major royal jelly family protein [Deinococcus radiodurans]